MTIDLLMDYIARHFFEIPYYDMSLSDQIFCVLIAFSMVLFLFIFYVKFVLWLFRLAGG